MICLVPVLDSWQAQNTYTPWPKFCQTTLCNVKTKRYFSFDLRQITFIGGCARWSVGRLVAFVRRSMAHVMANLALFHYTISLTLRKSLELNRMKPIINHVHNVHNVHKSGKRSHPNQTTKIFRRVQKWNRIQNSYSRWYDKSWVWFHFIIIDDRKTTKP